MLDVSHISKTFNPGRVTEKHAMTDASLHLREGDFVTVIGGNGAGKSTFLNAIAGTFRVDGGHIRIDGIDVTNLREFERAKWLGRVFQDPMTGTAAGMDIEENMALAARRGMRRSPFRWGITKMERQAFRDKLAMLGLGLEDRLHSKVGLLSGGQRQALTLLMSILRRPKVLLLDEHTAALDPKTADKVLTLTNDLIQSQRLTTLMITHNMHDALRLGNRTIMMHDGRVILDIPAEKKRTMKVEDLLHLFEDTSGRQLANDRMLLS